MLDPFFQWLGGLWRAVKIAHTQPGKGGAYLQVELKNLKDGTKLNERFRSSEKVDRVSLQQKDYQYLYQDEMFNFMDTETYEQIAISTDDIGDDAVFLQDGMMVVIVSPWSSGSRLIRALPRDCGDACGRRQTFMR